MNGLRLSDFPFRGWSCWTESLFALIVGVCIQFSLPLKHSLEICPNWKVVHPVRSHLPRSGSPHPTLGETTASVCLQEQALQLQGTPRLLRHLTESPVPTSCRSRTRCSGPPCLRIRGKQLLGPSARSVLSAPSSRNKPGSLPPRRRW